MLATIPGHAFDGASGIRTLTMDSTATVAAQAFVSCTSVREVYFPGTIPTFASDAFKSWSAGQSRLHLPKDSAEWRAWADANATAWWDLDDDTRDSYFDRWPREKKPYARTKASTVPANQWVVGWTPPGRGTFIILR